MSGMLQPNEYYHHEVERHQQEARQWARTDALGRVARATSEQVRRHPLRSRFLALAPPIGVALGLLAISL